MFSYYFKVNNFWKHSLSFCLNQSTICWRFTINDYPEIQNQFKEQGYFYENRSNNLSESLTQLFDEIKIKTLLLLPLYLDGNLFGFIGLDDSEKNKSWQKEDIDIFISFAKNLESVIEKNIEK